MKIQVNSDNSITVDASLTRFIEGEVSRILGRFAKRLTRLEVHLSDVDNRLTGQADKRCLIEVRPAGTGPLSASAKATEIDSAVREALGKMQRSLNTFFGRKGRPAAAVSGAVSPPIKTPAGTKKRAAVKKAAVKKAAVKKAAVKKAAVKKAAVKKAAKLSPEHSKKKKGIYQARRKSWPNP